ncbi:MAG: DUF2934 domain-containing protein [bacterium]
MNSKKNTTTKIASKKTTTSFAKTATVAAPVTKSAPTPAPAPVRTITQADRQRLIEQAAYFRAEKQGFQGNAQDHFNAAMAEIDADLAKKKIRVV